MLDDFFRDAQPYVRRFDEWVERLRPRATADHLCYKCSSSGEFESIRAMFESNSSFVYQSIISQRRIAIVKFLRPIPSTLGDIFYLELADQKPDGLQKSGFDHIEIFPNAGSMEDFVQELEEQGASGEKVVRPHHVTFDIPLEGSFKVRIEQEQLIWKIVRDEMGAGTVT